ncbi:protein tamozhennic [Euwallacea similis]|uniref:protein tamozhennic n=1 Tax=Euwallacea similis TaxID=1736056 RepID=UPI00344D3B88
MVIMENYYSPEKCHQLWIKINQMHLSYLELEESPEKIRQREKLEECIGKFLFMAEHRNKFLFAETEDVLYKSAVFKKDFSGYKATVGWNALQIYAANLLTQPWRQEYRQIKTFSGFYKHQIEANLLGAEAIFEAMGYKNIGSGVLVLEGPICPDKVLNVSKDCLIAYVECQILKHIWEEVASIFPVSWLDILEHRAEFCGSIDNCVRSLKMKCNSKKSLRLSRGESFDNVAASSSQGSVNGRMVVPNSQNYSLSGHNHVALSSVVVPTVPYCVPHTNGCISTIPYGYGTYPAQVPLVKQVLPSVLPVHNGYYYTNGVAMIPSAYPVPTGQLVEVDSRNGYDMVDEGLSSNMRNRIDSNGLLNTEKDSKAEDVFRNGMKSDLNDKQEEVEENWDYVYKNLEKQGYRKDLGERGDILGLTVSDKQRRHSKESKRVKATNLDEVMINLSVTDRPLKMTEALEHMEKTNVEKTSVQPAERSHSQGSSYENLTTNDTTVKPIKRVLDNTSTAAVGTSKSGSRVPSDTIQPKKAAKLDCKQGASPTTKWECKSCTYLNALSKTICEMCGKSRNVASDQPMEVGGPECSKCTLVNPRTAKTCNACGNNLKNSPTYI